MREGVLEGLKWIVTGAMFVAVGVIAGLCLLLILRAQAFRPLANPWRRRKKKKSAPEEEEDGARRQKIQILSWGGR
jgi:hypothetical protein